MAERKFKRRKLPFAILTGYEQEATKEFARLMRVGLQVITRDLETAQPDAEEATLMGTKAEGMEKSLSPRDLQNERSRLTYERRLRYGAPLHAAFGERSANLLLNLLPSMSGQIRLDRQLGRYATDLGLGQETVVPLTAIAAIHHVDNLKLRDALTGVSRRIPTALRHPGTDAYTVTDGGEEVLAARAAFVPAMLMTTYFPEDAQPPPPDSDLSHQLQEIEDILRRATVDVAYQLPSMLEPLAEVARAYDLDTFLGMALPVAEEEAAARARSLAKERDRATRWIDLYNAAVNGGQESEVAAARVRKDARWVRIEEIAEIARELRVKVEEKWESRREEFRRAFELSQDLAKEDGIQLPENLNFGKFWAHARRGESVDDTAGNQSGIYQLNQEVEVRDLSGTWHKATVTKIDGFDVRVRRVDGQHRLVRDLATIRLLDDPAGKVDIGSEIWYNKDVKNEIRLPEFSVILPAGSKSLEIENELEPITAELNATPLVVNAEIAARNKDRMEKELERLNAECRALAGWPEFRPNASADCIEVFNVQRGLPVQRVSKKTGTPAMDKETLTVFAALGDDLAEKVIEAREARSKLSQLESWEEFADAGSVQASWNQLGTPHGRYSCDSPNLQNRITEIRESVEPPSGYSFLSLDLGQAEYVTWASLSGDPTLTAAFGAGKDFHEQMGQEICDAAPDVDRTTNFRKFGKTINFALLYRMQAFVLAKRLGVSTEQAEQIMEAYAKRAPIAVAYMARTVQEFQRTGKATTKFGRERYLPEVRTATRGKLHEITKTLWHHHNAGTAAELLKIKQIKTWKALRRAGYTPEQVRLGLQMHDEIILIVRDDVLAEVEQIAREKFEEIIPGFLPFRVDVRRGKNWLQISK